MKVIRISHQINSLRFSELFQEYVQFLNRLYDITWFGTGWSAYV